MKNKVINALIEMGVPANIKGFGYIVDAILIFEENEDWVSVKSMALYSKIAKMNGDTYTRVERAIRHAFSSVLRNGEPIVVNKYLTYQNASNSNLLAILYYRLKMEE